MVCISSAMMLDANRAFLTAACLVFVGGSLAVLLLVVLLSKRAVGPVAESYQRQRQFVTDASHELKTPLTLLQANLDILESEAGENPWLSDMKAEAFTMTQLVRRLVDLARLDEEAPLQSSFFDLAQAVWETAAAFLPAAEQSGKRLTWEGPPSLLWKGDEGALRQLVSILLDNAVKYCDPEGPSRWGSRGNGTLSSRWTTAARQWTAFPFPACLTTSTGLTLPEPTAAALGWGFPLRKALQSGTAEASPPQSWKGAASASG